jgi:hypothetical protein
MKANGGAQTGFVDGKISNYAYSYSPHMKESLFIDGYTTNMVSISTA